MALQKACLVDINSDKEITNAMHYYASEMYCIINVLSGAFCCAKFFLATVCCDASL